MKLKSKLRNKNSSQLYRPSAGLWGKRERGHNIVHEAEYKPKVLSFPPVPRGPTTLIFYRALRHFRSRVLITSRASSRGIFRLLRPFNKDLAKFVQRVQSSLSPSPTPPPTRPSFLCLCHHSPPLPWAHRPPLVSDFRPEPEVLWAGPGGGKRSGAWAGTRLWPQPLSPPRIAVAPGWRSVRRPVGAGLPRTVRAATFPGPPGSARDHVYSLRRFFVLLVFRRWDDRSPLPSPQFWRDRLQGDRGGRGERGPARRRRPRPVQVSSWSRLLRRLLDPSVSWGPPGCPHTPRRPGVKGTLRVHLLRCSSLFSSLRHSWVWICYSGALIWVISNREGWTGAVVWSTSSRICSVVKFIKDHGRFGVLVL